MVKGLLVLAFEKEVTHTRSLLSRMGLNEYQSSVLAYLLFLGETKATALSKISEVPARGFMVFWIS